MPPLVLDRETAFHAARRDMLLAYRAWVVTDPDPRDLAIETEATIAALRRLRGEITT